MAAGSAPGHLQNLEGVPDGSHRIAEFVPEYAQNPEEFVTRVVRCCRLSAPRAASPSLDRRCRRKHSR